MGRHGWRLLAATRTWAGCCWCGGAVPDWCAAHVLTSIAVDRVLSSHAHCPARSTRYVREWPAGVHVCGGAPHMMSMVSTSSHVRDHATHATWLSHAHARAPRSVRTSTLHVGGCMFLAEPAMFLLTWCFCCSGQCFCFVFARRANVFACVWSQI